VNEYEVPADKVEVIPSGVDPDKWSRSTPRTKHEGPVRILFVGGDFERKGGPLLLSAWRTLKALDVELHVVTRSQLPVENGLHVYSDLQPNSAELIQLYHDCDIFCLPTRGDAVPHVLSEAGAAGLPVVATCVAAIPEIVRDGETGFLVSPEDEQGLVAALTRLVESPELRFRQGRRAVEIIRRDFDARRTAQRLVDLLKKTVDEARGVTQVGA
jgi:glycosyltransferase involved in cell wall biosynthesis